MPLQLSYPGVYTQEIPTGVKTISSAPTSVAMFMGPTLSGIDRRATRIQSFPDFQRLFGGLSQASNLSYSVLHFFANGGGDAYVYRIPADQAAPASITLKTGDGGGDGLTATALSSGAASNELFVELDQLGIGAQPFTASADKLRFNLTVMDRVTGLSERFTNLSMASSNARFAETVVNDVATGSQFVALKVNKVGGDAPQATGSTYSIGKAPAAGPDFIADVIVNLSVGLLDASGAADAANSIANLPVTVFPNKSVQPTSVLELANRLTAAINNAIRADPNASKVMEGIQIEAAPFEGNTLLRLRVVPPTTTKPSKRVSDATVKLSDPASGTKFLATYTIKPQAIGNTRYELGTKYTSVVTVSATVTGKDDPSSLGQPSSQDFHDGVAALDVPDPFFNLLCIPDLVRAAADNPTTPLIPDAMTVYSEAALVCEHKYAVLLVDPLPNVTDVGGAAAWKSTGFPFQSDHTAAYFPNIRVDDPLSPGTIRSHPPSGAIAGVIARTDTQYGVWEAPAGTEAVVSGSYGPSIVLSNTDQGVLNPLGLNVVRQFPIFGTVSFGSRTVDGSDALASDYKYIPVRRTACYILRSLSEGLRWAVHKPNGDALWAQIRLNVTAFMQTMFRQGAFKGTSPRDAYFVLCDATTTTSTDIDNGVVNVIVGFSPLKPAEFVVVSLRQIVQPAA
jgi:phage tail sheath protein FI